MGVKQFRFTIEGISGDLGFIATFAASNNFIFTIMSKFIELKTGGCRVLIDVDKITHIVEEKGHPRTLVVFDDAKVMVDVIYETVKSKLVSLSGVACKSEQGNPQ